MVAQMLMQPVGKESLDQKVADENYFQPIDIPLPGMLSPLDMQGGFFMSPETAKKVAYGGAVAGASFVPGAGFVDAYGGAVDITGQPLLSFGENIGQGNYLDAALQGLGVAGDMATFAAPFTAGTSLALAAMLKAPGAARKVTKATEVASDVSKVVETPKSIEQIGSIAKVEPPTETQPGIIAFHGSGADFDEFNLEYIDTGEGAQAFGHGLYFSNSKDIGDFYKNALTRSVDIDGKPYIRGNSIRNTELLDPDIADELGAANGDLELAIKNEEEYLQTLTGSQPSNTALDTATKETQKRIEKLKALRGRVTVNPTEGKTYKVAIQPKPEELLDYDLPLSEQPKILEKIENLAAVKKLREEGVNAFSPDDIASFFELNQIEKFNGQEFLRFLEDAKTTSGKDVVSKELNNVGIKGIKYKAGQLTPRKFKAADEKQSENYVIFDDKIIKVLEKYGIVGPVAVSATAAALKDDDGST